MSFISYLRGFFHKSKRMEFEAPTHPTPRLIDDKEFHEALQRYLVEFIEFNLMQRNGHAVNSARAFRDHVAETCSKLNS